MLQMADSESDEEANSGYVLVSAEENQILVTSIPEGVDHELLELYFEHKEKSGGGDVKDVDINYEQHSAIVTFLDAAVAKSVLGRKHTLNGKTLGVEKYIKPQAKPQPSATVVVLGTKGSISKEMLVLYFENRKKSGGGVIRQVDMCPESEKCYVTFWDPEVAQRVVEHPSHKLRNLPLAVCLTYETPLSHVRSQEKVNVARSESASFNLMSDGKSSTDSDQHEAELQGPMSPLDKEGMHSDLSRDGMISRDGKTLPDNGILSDGEIDEGTQCDDEIHEVPAESPCGVDAENQLKDNTSASLSVLGDATQSGPTSDSQDQHAADEESLHLSLDADIIDSNDEDEEVQGDAAAAGEDSDPSQDDAGNSDEVMYQEESYTDEAAAAEYGEIDEAESRNLESGNESPLFTGVRTLEISGIPKRTNLVHINHYMGHFSPAGVDGLERVALDVDTGIARVTYKDERDAQNLLLKRIIQFGDGNALVVDPYYDGDAVESADAAEEDVNDDAMGKTVEVHGIPNDIQKDVIEMFFESKKRSGGGEIEDLELHAELGVAYVTFVKPQDAHEVVIKKVVNLPGAGDLTVDWPSSSEKPASADMELDALETTTEAESQTVIVTGFPSDAQTDLIGYLFENKRRSGGGPIEQMKFDCDKGVAIIRYRLPSDAANVVERETIPFNGQVLQVNWYTDVQDEPKGAVCVTGLPDDTGTDMIQMLFENKKRTGGGPIRSIELNTTIGQAVIVYENPEDAERVLSKKSKLCIGSNTLKISSCDSQGETSQPIDTAMEARKMNEVKVDTIKVTGFKVNEQRDVIYLFFENKRRSGGGDILDLNFDDKKAEAFITYKNPKDAEGVLEKYRTSRLTFNGQELNVQALEPALSDPSGDSPSLAVVVTNINKNTDNDIILLFFENENRSGGGRILEMERMGPNEAVITFKTVEIARSVEKHWPLKLEGNVLEARQLRHSPPPVAPPRGPIDPLTVCLHEVPDSAEPDNIKQYLGLTSKSCEVTEVIFGTVPGTVLVHFDKAPDYTALRELCNQRPLRGVMISIQRVPTTSSMQVFGVKHDMMDHLQLYLENTRRSGGGRMQGIDTYLDMGYVIVNFEDAEVMKRVAKKAHQLGDCALQVRPYYKCIGCIPPDHDTSMPALNVLPEPVSIDWENKACMRFLLGNQTLKHVIEDKLDKKACTIEWPSEVDEHIILKCNLSPDIWGFAKLCKEWENDVFECLQEYLRKIQSHEVWTVAEVFVQLKECVAEYLKKNRVDPVDLSVEMVEEESLIRLVGTRDLVERLGKDFMQLAARIEEQHQLATKTVVDLVKNLKPWQLSMLSAIHFSGDMRRDYPDLRVTIKGLDVEISGKNSDVVKAKTRLLEVVNGLMQDKVKFGGTARELLRERNTREFILQGLPSDVHIVWNSSKTQPSVIVYALKKKHVTLGTELLKQKLTEAHVDVDPASKYVFGTEEWQSVIRETREESVKGRVIIRQNDNCTAVDIAATSDIFNKFHGEVQQLLKNGMAIEKLLKSSMGVAKLLEIALKPKLNKICEDLKHYGIEISPVMNPKNPGVLVRGARSGLKEATDAIQVIIDNVFNHKYTVSKPGMAKYFGSKQGGSFLDSLEKQHSVGIEIEDESSPQPVGTGAGTKAVVTLSTGQKLTAMLGDLTKFPSGAIVNAANETLHHAGGVAKAIADAGGRKFVQESSEYVKQHGSVKPGHVCVTGSGRLPCSSVIHAVGPTWRGGHSNEDQLLFNAVHKAMDAAENCRVSQIAMPAISTGVYHFPLETATKTIVQAVNTYFVKNPGSCVKEVFFMDVLPATVSAFCEAFYGVFGSDNVMRSGSSGVADAARPGPVTRSTRSMISMDLRSSCLTTQNGVTLKIVTGALATEKVDAVVNSSNTKLDLKLGYVSKSLLDSAGPELQHECHKKKPDGIQVGEMLATKGYKLPCRRVLHVVCRKWGERDSEQVLEKIIKSSLDWAEDEKAESLAFPALGTGGLKVPVEVVARLLVKHVIQHSKTVRHSLLTDIRVILTPHDELLQEAFQQEIKKHQTSSSKHDQGHDGEGHKRGAKSRSNYRRSSASDHRAGSEGKNGASCMIGTLKLEVVQGDITKETTDAIVNSSDSKLGLHGAVAKALVKAGGPSIEEECRSTRKPINQVAVTRAGKLDVNHIIHIVAPSARAEWSTAIQACLKQADTMRLQAISLPALGTGMLKVSSRDMATTLLDAIHGFVKDQQPVVLSHVRIVIFQGEMVDEFVKAMKALIENQGGLWGRFTRYMNIGEETFVKEVDSVSSRYRSPSPTKHEPKATTYSTKKPLSNRLVLSVFGGSKTHVADAIKDISEECSSKCTTKVLNSPKDQTAIARLTEQQVRKILGFEQVHDVKIKLETRSDKKYIRIEGQSADVVTVLHGVTDVLRDVENYVRMRSEGRILSNHVMWEFQESRGSTTYKPYRYERNSQLEQAYKSKQKTLEWTDGSVRFTVDFQKMIESSDDSTRPTIKIRRTEKGEHKLPKIWSAMKDETRVLPVSLDPTKWEYQEVEKQLKATGGIITVIKIDRIQNPSLFQRYAIHRDSMNKVNPQGTVNEKILWHGTSADVIPQINGQGFNRSYCGRHGTSIGKGVYFAEQASYSISGYSHPDRQGHRHIYKCRVLTGRSTQGNSTMIDAPPINPSDPSVKYDSVSSPGMYVIFSDTQAYPEYLITFK